MAEGWARKLLEESGPGNKWRIESAGLEAHGLNPLAVSAMARHGVDISAQTSDVLTTQMLEQADILVTVCSHADTNCPLIPAQKKKIHLPFFDPAKAQGSDKEIDACFDAVCLEIKQEISALLESLLDRPQQ